MYPLGLSMKPFVGKKKTGKLTRTGRAGSGFLPGSLYEMYCLGRSYYYTGPGPVPNFQLFVRLENSRY